MLICPVCVYIHRFLNNRRVCNSSITLAQCCVVYLIATAVVLHSQEICFQGDKMRWRYMYIITKKILC